MPRRLVQESRAERDIARHLELYLERELFDTADRFIDVLEAACHTVRDHPRIAPVSETEHTELRALGLPIWPLGHGFHRILADAFLATRPDDLHLGAHAVGFDERADGVTLRLPDDRSYDGDGLIGVVENESWREESWTLKAPWEELEADYA